MSESKSAGRERLIETGHDIPRGARLAEVVEAYEVDDDIPCGIPTCRTPHRRGFMVAFACDDGSTGLGRVGHVCGERAFGLDWKQHLATFETRKHLAAMQERAAECLAACDAVEPRLPSLLPLASAVDEARRSIEVSLPDLFSACVHAAKSDGRVRRWVWDDKKVAGVQLAGRSFWVKGPIAQRLRRLASDIQVFRKAVDDPKTKLPRLSEMLAAIGFPEQRLSDLETELRAALEALRPGTMARIVEELAKGHSGSFGSMEQGQLVRWEMETVKTGGWFKVVDLVNIVHLGKEALVEPYSSAMPPPVPPDPAVGGRVRADVDALDDP